MYDLQFNLLSFIRSLALPTRASLSNKNILLFPLAYLYLLDALHILKKLSKRKQQKFLEWDFLNAIDQKLVRNFAVQKFQIFLLDYVHTAWKRAYFFPSKNIYANACILLAEILRKPKLLPLVKPNNTKSHPVHCSMCWNCIKGFLLIYCLVKVFFFKFAGLSIRARKMTLHRARGMRLKSIL